MWMMKVLVGERQKELTGNTDARVDEKVGGADNDTYSKGEEGRDYANNKPSLRRICHLYIRNHIHLYNAYLEQLLYLALFGQSTGRHITLINNMFQKRRGN